MHIVVRTALPLLREGAAVVMVSSVAAHTGAPHHAHYAAAGKPQAYVQMKAGHSQGAITERYIHAAAVPFPGAPLLVGLVGAVVLGVLGSREGVLRTLRGIIGAAGGCALG